MFARWQNDAVIVFSVMYFYISQKLYKNPERQKTAGEIVIGETNPIFKKSLSNHSRQMQKHTLFP